MRQVLCLFVVSFAVMSQALSESWQEVDPERLGPCAEYIILRIQAQDLGEENQSEVHIPFAYLGEVRSLPNGGNEARIKVLVHVGQSLGSVKERVLQRYQIIFVQQLRYAEDDTDTGALSCEIESVEEEGPES